MSKIKIAATPFAKMLAREKGLDLNQIVPTGKLGEIRARDVLNHSVEKRKITPLARRIAEALEIDLARVSGSGYKGRIFKTDLKGISYRTQDCNGSDKKMPLTQMRKTIGFRMLKSHREIPPITLNTKADVTRLLSIKSDWSSFSWTINDFILKATAMALQEHPNINAVLEEDTIIYKTNIHLGLAVSIPGGLFVPHIKDADRASLQEISERTKDLIRRTKNNELTPDECVGSTFTITNLGMFGITSFTPIINQPEAAILGVCAIEDVLKLYAGQVMERKVMNLSFTHDHRLIDGAEGALFLQTLVKKLENPDHMIFEA